MDNLTLDHRTDTRIVELEEHVRSLADITVAQERIIHLEKKRNFANLVIGFIIGLFTSTIVAVFVILAKL